MPTGNRRYSRLGNLRYAARQDSAPYLLRPDGRRGAPSLLATRSFAKFVEFVPAPIQKKIGTVAELPPPDDYSVEESFQGQ